MGIDPVIIDAVKNENGKGKTLAQIKDMDKMWKGTPGVADYMKALVDSACGKHLRSVQEKEDHIAEVFVMDSQGANVPMTDKASDYWQGDVAITQQNAANSEESASASEQMSAQAKEMKKW